MSNQLRRRRTFVPLHNFSPKAEIPLTYITEINNFTRCVALVQNIILYFEKRMEI
jgi:hypothetical protein